jgi:hypothetical protein
MIHLYRDCNHSNTTDTSSGRGTYPSGEAEYIAPVSRGIRVAPSCGFCVVLYRPLFVYLAILSCLVCPSIYGFRVIFFGIFKLFLLCLTQVVKILDFEYKPVKPLYTRQKYFRTKIFSYIFHIKPLIFIPFS